MAILGFSGFNDAVRFKRQRFAHLAPRQHHIVQGHDAAAALVGDHGILAAASQERFDRNKVTGAFPVDAMRYCLQAAGIDIRQITAVAHAFDHGPLEALYRETDYTAQLFDGVYARKVKLDLLSLHFPGPDWAARLVEVPHHLAHAASAFYPSGFDDALIVVADGMGEMAAITVAVGDQDGIRILDQIDAPHSLGLLYGIGTLYLGFWMGLDEYKVMGLAPYGDRNSFYESLMELVELGPGGRIAIPLIGAGATLEDRETYGKVIDDLARRFGPARGPAGQVERHHLDFAAALQAVLETALLHVIRAAREATGVHRLCLAGGVALNCTANARIQREALFDRIFVQPAAGDDGSALGAALQVRQAGGGGRLAEMDMPFWGPSYNDDTIGAALDRHGVASTLNELGTLIDRAVELLVDGRILGWFQDRMEFGPRALGNRSILADPRGAGKRDRINAAVKKRESFRPFAPAVTEAAAPEFFEMSTTEASGFRHMLMITGVRPEKRAQLEAVTHIDGSARVQVVTPHGNPRFHRLLAAFGAQTGVPILLNTSFNVMGQPIVCTPEDAVSTFLSSGLDALVIGDRIALRRGTEVPGRIR